MKINFFNISRHAKNLIPKKLLEDLVNDASRVRIFDPLTTLYLFLNQILTNSSSQTALATFNIDRIKSGLKTTSLSTSAYTRAKAKLCELKLREISLKTGEIVDRRSVDWNWCGRNVFFGDGTIINMLDTEKNRNEYPPNHYKGVNVAFPKLRLLGIFSANSGALVDAEISEYCGKGRSEPSLLLKMLDRLKSGSVLVLDRFFTSLSLQAILQDYGIDYVIRGRDKFVKRMLGRKKDKIITIKKDLPGADSIYLGMDYNKEITIRLIQSDLARKGFRTKKIYIVTSLLSEKCEDIKRIYLERWGVELDIRNFKTTMESNLINSKTPQAVRRELWVRVLAYNLVRNLTVLSSTLEKDGPRKRSFKLILKNYTKIIKTTGNDLINILFQVINKISLKSKYRREARALKSRKNRYPILTTTREKAKEQDWGYKRRRPRRKPVVVLGALNPAA